MEYYNGIYKLDTSLQSQRQAIIQTNDASDIPSSDGGRFDILMNACISKVTVTAFKL